MVSYAERMLQDRPKHEINRLWTDKDIRAWMEDLLGRIELMSMHQYTIGDGNVNTNKLVASRSERDCSSGEASGTGTVHTPEPEQSSVETLKPQSPGWFSLLFAASGRLS